MYGGPDAPLMDAALDEAQAALGTVWPNPAVGCVIARDGALIARARTAPGGRPHAETEALRLAGGAATGATAYVTLEPCAHHGVTGPCAEALINAGIARCVIAIEDPDPRVAGRGIARLKAAGVAVDLGLGAERASEICAGFFMRLKTGRPRVTLKLAQSLDGRIALASGASRWITGPAARAYVHELRRYSDAILIGAGTARMDDPMLDLREGQVSPRPPVRIVADPGLSLPPSSRLADTAALQPLWLLHRAGQSGDALSARGADLIETEAAPDGLHLPSALQTLGGRGLTSILCEGGGRLAAGLIGANCVDELVLLIAGKIIGGDGTPSVGTLALSSLDLAPRFQLLESAPLGDDLLTRWAPL